tara:strand:+ start:1795 stop:2115 length:321 start_codon:yes stop_codon:yes gene_type:complete
MWNSKKGFEEFLSIVKKMPSMHNNHEYSQYNWRAYNEGYYTTEIVNVELLMKFVGTIENLGEEDKIHRLKLWASQRIGQQVDAKYEFRETRKQLEYYNRRVKFNDS